MTTATSSTNRPSGCFSSDGSSITSRPIRRNVSTRSSCSFLARSMFTFCPTRKSNDELSAYELAIRETKAKLYLKQSTSAIVVVYKFLQASGHGASGSVGRLQQFCATICTRYQCSSQHVCLRRLYALRGSAAAKAPRSLICDSVYQIHLCTFLCQKRLPATSASSFAAQKFNVFLTNARQLWCHCALRAYDVFPTTRHGIDLCSEMFNLTYFLSRASILTHVTLDFSLSVRHVNKRQ